MGKMNLRYGFQREAIHKYSLNTFSLAQSLFNSLPFAVLIENKKCLVVHGGNFLLRLISKFFIT